jgi:hypothetical protein
MRNGVLFGLAYGAILLGAPLTAAYAQWLPGSEIVGQSVQVETNGVVNTIYFDAGGGARILSPGGSVVNGTWSAADQQLCLQTATGQECWPYKAAFKAGQQVAMMSSCQVASRWTPLATNPMQAVAGERG